MFDEPLYLIVAGVVAVIIVAVLLLLLRKKRTQDQTQEDDDESLSVHCSPGVESERGVDSNLSAHQVHKSQKLESSAEIRQESIQDQLRNPGQDSQSQDLSVDVHEKEKSKEDLNWNNVPTTAQVSVSQVEDLTEYQVYKQFGYFDKAAKSLSNYLIYQKEKPKELVSELFGLYLETGDLESLSVALDEYYQIFSMDELEAIVKLGFELDPNNLALRVFAEEKMGWSSDEIGKKIGDLSNSLSDIGTEASDKVSHQPDITSAKEENIQNQFHSNRVSIINNVDSYVDKEPLVLGFRRVANITEEEQNAIVSFVSDRRAVKLLTKEVEYSRAVLLFDRALKHVKRPASIAIEALSLDFKYKNIENYAHHLWVLYFVLGQCGRLIKEKMLGWGYGLGNHPIFTELDLSPSEYELREIGVKYGYLSDTVSNIKAKMLPLVEQNHGGGQAVVQVGGAEANLILQEAESQLDYGQLEEAMETLENGILKEGINEPQIYMMLFDLYERSESWERFERFSREIRSKVSELPEEVIVVLSRLMQEIK